jgi:hypothetical protein
MAQLLHLLNGDTVVRKVSSGESRLAKMLKANKSDAEILDELFMLTVGHSATEETRKIVEKSLKDSGNRDELMRDVFWALMNTKEFTFNH